MKILMLNYEFPPIGGGASPVTFELSRHLVKLGYQVDVVTMHYKKLPRYESIEGVRIYRTPALRSRPDICRTYELATYVLGAVFKVLKLTKQHKYDLIHCHFIVPSSPLAWLVFKLRKIPYLVTCHGSDVPGYNPDRFSLMHKLITPAWKYLAQTAPMLISPSQSLKNLIQEKCPDLRINVIPNGIYSDNFIPEEKTKSILMCSRILPRKGFQYAIEAISGLELDWQVNIVGEGPYLEELQKKAKNSKTPIKFWGWLDKSDPRFYNLFVKSAIFIFPSEAENFPTVLLEAMASGMAIITSTAGGCSEVVGESALFVEPRNVEEIRNQLVKLIESEKLTKELSKAAIYRAKEFNWESVAKQYIELYQKLIKSSNDKKK